MGPVPVVTVDLGNSRLKACHWLPGAAGFECTDLWDAENGTLDGFEPWLARLRPAHIAISSVATSATTQRVGALLSVHAARVSTPDAGLENRCRQPERVGQDRLYAALGAATWLRSSAVIVDAGTTLTVDAMRLEGTRRVFLGGSIAPGPGLLASALAAGTAQLPRIEPRPGAPALGTVTEDAIQAGVVVGFRGAAMRLVEEVGLEAGLEDAPIVLTGGAREFLLVPTPFTTRRIQVVPDLVHRGLLAALLRSLGVPERA